MAIDYKKTAELLVKELGGDENISNISHCATRLRFILKDESNIDNDKVSKIPGVITTVQAGGQYQVVIGNHVKDAYNFVMELVSVDDNQEPLPQKKVGVFSRIIDVISSIFAPFLYTLAACGILQGILGIFVAMNSGITDSGTYKILNFISWTAFTYLPVLIAITGSKKFGLNTFVGVVIACALVCPDYIAMVNSGEPIKFLGINVQLLSYTSSVIPIILAVWIASYVYKFFDKYLPLVIRNLFAPMFTIAIMVPLTLLAFGPIGNTIGNAIGGTYNFLYGLSPIVAGIIVGGLWEVLVIFGVHWGITPVTVGNYANLGYDTFTGLQASAVFSQAGAALGVFLKSKDKDLKGVSLSAAITGLFGITEPAIYGVNLRFKKPMVLGCISGAVGGAIAGGFNAVSWGYNMPGIATLPNYFKAGHTTQFVGLVISILVSFFLATILTYLFGFKDEPTAIASTENGEIEINTDPGCATAPEISGSLELGCPVKGSVIPVSQVKDKAFASEAMGKGVGIIPVDGKVYAPFDGTVGALTETKHAIGITSPSGIEAFIHIGIDTVGLNGQGFSSYVEEGDQVEKGQLLLEFNPKMLKKEGYDNTVIFIVPSLGTGSSIETKTGFDADVNQTVITVE